MTIEWDHAGVIIQLLWALVTGVAAGATFFVGYYWREKAQTESIRRIERFVEWSIQILLATVEVHNEFHPEAKVDTGGLSKLLFDATNRTWHP